MSSHNISLIIPAHNESKTVGGIIREIRNAYPQSEIIVVDDGSVDNTADVAQKAGAKVCKHPYNIGNGAAIKTGIRAASGEILVLMDGDGQHDPSDIEKLLLYLPSYDMVVGARKFSQQASWARGFGNKAYNWLASYVAKFPVQDLTSGFRAIKADLARRLLYLLPNTYSYPTTLTLGVLRNGRSVKYVPIEVQPRKSGKSNVSLFRDGVRFFMILNKICTLYSPMRIFLPLSFSMFLLGISYYLYTYLSQGRFTNMGAVLLTTSILIFLMGLISEQITLMRYQESEHE